MALAKTLTQRIEQAAGISAATCSREGSPENNYNVILDLKSTVYALALELQEVAEALRDGEMIDAEKLALYASLAGAYELCAHARLDALAKCTDRAFAGFERTE